MESKQQSPANREKTMTDTINAENAVSMSANGHSIPVHCCNTPENHASLIKACSGVSKDGNKVTYVKTERTPQGVFIDYWKVVVWVD
jgi:hypothetical protein